MPRRRALVDAQTSFPGQHSVDQPNGCLAERLRAALQKVRGPQLQLHVHGLMHRGKKMKPKS
jgi:hypothetical protein